MRKTVNLFVGYAILVFFGLVFLYPFVIQVASSFKSEPDAAANALSPVPSPVDTDSFTRLFAGTHLPLWLGNSLLVTVLVTAGRVLLDSMAGYALARLRFRGRRGVFAAVIAVMAVPGVVLLIPKFLVLNQLGVYDSYVALILPLLADAAGVFIMKQFFESVPVIPQAGRPGQRLVRAGHPVPAEARRGAAGHDPGRHRLRGVPALFRARRQRGWREGLTVRALRLVG